MNFSEGETMDVEQHVRLWNQASIKIMDIRRHVLRTGEQVSGYLLPASVFLFAAKGSALLALDGQVYESAPTQVLHGGKGFALDITDVEDLFEYYMIFYRAWIPVSGGKELQARVERHLPFHIQYALVPPNPLVFYTYLHHLNHLWKQGEALSQFQVKTIFYQFVHEVLSQLDRQGARTLKPNPVTQAIRYLEERYAEAFSVEGLAELLDCSAGHLSRRFKKETGSSLVEYLTRVRMNKAKELLLQADVSIQAIAESVGIPDAVYFNRIFKKNAGISPGRFKTDAASWTLDQYNARGRSESSIVRRKLRRYIDRDDNYYQYKTKGDSRIPMNSKHMMTLFLMLSLTLFLSACSGVSNTTLHPNSNAAQQANLEPAAQQPSSQETVIKHAWGETVIKGEPQNIISLFPAATDYLLALGIVPKAASSNEEGSNQFPTYLADRLQGQKNLGWQVEPNLESILALKPDLIIGQEFMGDAFDSLTKIAPTLFAEKVKDEQGIIRMRMSLLKLGDMLGRTEQANQVIAEYDKLAAASKEQIHKAIGNESVMFLRLSDKELRYYSKRNYEVLYDDLGLQEPPMMPQPTESMQVISLEVLPSINPDHIFLLSSNPAEETEMQKTEVWKKLKAVQNNHVYKVDYGLWFQGPGGPIGQTKIIEEAVQFLTR